MGNIQIDLETNGFALLNGVFSDTQVQELLAELRRVLSAQSEGVLGRDGVAYAARNLLELWPAVADVCRLHPLPSLLQQILGPEFGLVRALFFDKPPGSSWALPWHKDLAIAVKDNSQFGPGFSHPTTKAGVPHLEAPVQLLEQMLTARIHLDTVTPANGPLRVIPGSHRSGKQMSLGDVSPRAILANAGDVLLMRPLLAHASNHASADTTQHRRILHLEVAGCRVPGDNTEWHDYRVLRQGTGWKEQRENRGVG
jgi:hypothetical protein